MLDWLVMMIWSVFDMQCCRFVELIKYAYRIKSFLSV